MLTVTGCTFRGIYFMHVLGNSKMGFENENGVMSK